MRNYDGIFEVRPSLIGTLSTIAGTALGAPINVQGFRDVLGILVAGALAGSTGSTVNLAIKIQESTEAIGTGGVWTDITNNAYNQGSFNFTTLTFGDTTGTHLPYQMGKAYCVLKDGNRKQFIRAHATLTGTAGLGPKFSVTFLLGRPDDTLYVNNAVTVSSGNPQLTKLL